MTQTQAPFKDRVRWAQKNLARVRSELEKDYKTAMKAILEHERTLKTLEQGKPFPPELKDQVVEEAMNIHIQIDVS